MKIFSARESWNNDASGSTHGFRSLLMFSAAAVVGLAAMPVAAEDGADQEAEVVAPAAIGAAAVVVQSPVTVPPAPRIPGAYPGGQRLTLGVTSGIRWLEDWSHLADPANRSGSVLEALRYIPLGREDVYLSIGGQVRYNYTYWSRLNLGTTANEHLSATQQRLRVVGDLQVGRNFRAFVELGDNQEFGEEFGTPPNRDRWDIQQAFVDVTVPLGASGQVTVRPGRFEMPLGGGRLMGMRDGVNVRYIYEGVRATWDNPGVVRVDAFSVEPVSYDGGAWDNETIDGRSLKGVYVSTPRGKFIPNVAVEAFYFDTERASARYVGQTAKDDRQSYGLRLWGRNGAWDYDVEGVYQGGDYGASDIAAWGLMFDGGYTLKTRWSPRLGLRANAFSGDADLSDAEVNTFAPPFPRTPLYADAGWFNMSNLVDLFPNVTIKPTSKLAIMTGFDVMWRENSADAIYAGPTNFPMVWPVGGDRYVGTTYNLQGEYVLNNNINFRLYYARFQAGDAVKKGGGDNSDYFGFWTDFRF
jgi:hypothetical protein